MKFAGLQVMSEYVHTWMRSNSGHAMRLIPHAVNHSVLAGFK